MSSDVLFCATNCQKFIQEKSANSHFWQASTNKCLVICLKNDDQNSFWLVFWRSTKCCSSILLYWCESAMWRKYCVWSSEQVIILWPISFCSVKLVHNPQGSEVQRKSHGKTDLLVVLVLRLINTVSLVRMHYGSFVAVCCLALRGVGHRWISQPIL